MTLPNHRGNMNSSTRIYQKRPLPSSLSLRLAFLVSFLLVLWGPFQFASTAPSNTFLLVQAFPIPAIISTSFPCPIPAISSSRHSSWSRLSGAEEDKDVGDDEDIVQDGPPITRGTGLHAQIEQQQKQIEVLLSMVQKQQQQTQTEESSSPSHIPTTKSTQQPQTTSKFAAATAAVLPLKAMMFIDGTWLYYSIYERNEAHCPIIQRYGRGWQNRYSFDWSAVPRVVAQALQHQDSGWAVQSRPIDIARASVFTSYKADTSPHSFRFKMYQEMANANYDIHMMETVGKSEKCVDINIAVEMLHYATVPNAYDVAILLTGDKDFIPAMRRTRQKGRKVALVSFSKQRGCNPALYEDDPGDGLGNIRDYNVVWLEDHLDELIQPKSQAHVEQDMARVSTFTFMKILADFITASGFSRVSSRDIGMYLKDLNIEDARGTRTLNILQVLKNDYGGLFQFLQVSRIFQCIHPESHAERRMDKSFWVELQSDADVILVEEARKARFTKAETKFFDEYSLKALEDKETAYAFTLEKMYPLRSKPQWDAASSTSQSTATTMSPSEDSTTREKEPFVIPDELDRDFSEMKVAELKDFCREHELKVSGTKAELQKRIREYVDGRLAVLKAAHDQKFQSISKRGTVSLGENIDKTADEYITSLVMEYVHAAGGRASSRDVGRYLAANKASENRLAGSFGVRITALTELKELFKSLANFVTVKSDLFQRVDDASLREEAGSLYAFYIEQLPPGTRDTEAPTPQAQQQA